MAMSPGTPLERATAAARAEQPEDWPAVSDSIKRKVRETVLPARRIAYVSADGSLDQDEHGSRTHVSSRVLLARLRDALRFGPDLAAERIDLTIGDDDLLTRVEVDLVCAYDTDVRQAADLARSLVEGVLVEVLGPGARPPVDVHVTDVVVGDVRRD
ncbi:hypothetical protein L2K70_05785 [Nocardioides KLBMP 9356]|uniref:Asp23/Gls24 family envelope stress response protein n=1 Tax=Nocardioides potassii TaxID=2911371 RepID=A0ABS9HA56_9ACTN|nr:hypothetical protein [Nocardioides potassii]MCF6377104.1 hypothetical protein [Nocardioides potassii]